jgi:prephenate dehydrogenase
MNKAADTRSEKGPGADGKSVDEGLRWQRRRRPGLGFFGLGAFGAFAVPYLAPFFDLHLHDTHRDTSDIARRHGAKVADLVTTASQDILVIAVPFTEIAGLAKAIAAHVQPGALVLDVCSIKVKPLTILAEALPADVEIVGTHPLFGPLSGRAGIGGLAVTVCPVRGRSGPALVRFLRHRFGLAVRIMSAESHDAQMAYVQGLTHLLGRMVLAVEPPRLAHSTRSFAHLMEMVDTVRHDSDELFRTITAENPYMAEVQSRLFDAAQRLCGPDRRLADRPAWDQAEDAGMPPVPSR